MGRKRVDRRVNGAVGEGGQGSRMRGQTGFGKEGRIRLVEETGFSKQRLWIAIFVEMTIRRPLIREFP